MSPGESRLKTKHAFALLMLSFLMVACGSQPTPDPSVAAPTTGAEEAQNATAEAETGAAATADAEASAAATAEAEAAQTATAEAEAENASATADAEAARMAATATAESQVDPPADLPLEVERKVLEPGNDQSPEPGDILQVHLVGALEDGSEFANSYESGDPIVFPFGQGLFFPGWDLAIGMMTFGEKAEVFIPSELAFGPAGAPPTIPSNADLYLEVELLADPIDVKVEIIEEGSGEQALPGDTVRVHYTGTLEDGTHFDSSLDRGEPFEFVLGTGAVIPGWDIGIGRLHEGDKAILTIPPVLGYGPSGSPPVIPPNAVLIFEVELVSILR
jgi:peptidylprolyl isomerase